MWSAGNPGVESAAVSAIRLQGVFGPDAAIKRTELWEW
jgi:hypothetical protein